MQTILVVDDVQTDRELLGKVVSKAGHQPIFAETGQEAIEKAKLVHPALIFMDVVMPTQDGFKTTRELKKDPVTSRIPIVLVTSKSTDIDRSWGKRQGADDHVSKPFESSTVVEIINRYTR